VWTRSSCALAAWNSGQGQPCLYMQQWAQGQVHSTYKEHSDTMDLDLYHPMFTFLV
jgi:hypothetical protein